MCLVGITESKQREREREKKPELGRKKEAQRKTLQTLKNVTELSKTDKQRVAVRKLRRVAMKTEKKQNGHLMRDEKEKYNVCLRDGDKVTIKKKNM